jgi:23S rRNA-/tRNA-specific pseudouridylate synthase
MRLIAMVNYARIRKTFFSKPWRRRFEEKDSCPRTVREALAEMVHHIAPESWAAREKLGGIYLNGQAAALRDPITAPALVEYFEPLYSLEEADKFYPTFEASYVVHQDDDLAIVYKPAGLPTMAPRDQRLYHLHASLERHFKRTVHLPSRLDVMVSGLVLASLSERMNRTLQRAFEKRTIEKFYLLESEGMCEPARQEVKASLARDPRHPVLRRVVARGGEKAHTSFTSIGSGSFEGVPTSLVCARPHTGRTHQIRVHASSVGLTIIGDDYYDGLPSDDLHLISFGLRLWQPYLRKTLEVYLPDALCPRWIGSREDIINTLRSLLPVAEPSKPE